MTWRSFTELIKVIWIRRKAAVELIRRYSITKHQRTGKVISRAYKAKRSLSGWKSLTCAHLKQMFYIVLYFIFICTRMRKITKNKWSFLRCGDHLIHFTLFLFLLLLFYILYLFAQGGEKKLKINEAFSDVGIIWFILLYFCCCCFIFYIYLHKRERKKQK